MVHNLSLCCDWVETKIQLECDKWDTYGVCINRIRVNDLNINILGIIMDEIRDLSNYILYVHD